MIVSSSIREKLPIFQLSTARNPRRGRNSASLGKRNDTVRKGGTGSLKHVGRLKLLYTQKSDLPAADQTQEIAISSVPVGTFTIVLDIEQENRNIKTKGDPLQGLNDEGVDSVKHSSPQYFDYDGCNNRPDLGNGSYESSGAISS